ncbi:hypothetical protein CGLO_02190 [Colletotrichum gloeosporioides Cg-14]|uniref:Uncharacterized protein n=1 Tax=Colletotrichum gloeosporioides (strain Cg-14) TaxID=1237896 RepID=T0M1N4_COLGC|nr:hypothetical protein CGLO_02190 [Colletotrichum gloeosporioides Cg-14]
MRYLNTYCKK